jgi:hypothetical protein
VRIASLWRYPVKSMGGERIEGTDVTDHGFPGDRAFAVVDRADGAVASAKHPSKWAGLLAFAASYPDGPDHPAEITFPNGDTTATDDPDIDARLTRALSRDVTLATTTASGSYEAEWPDIEGVIPGDFFESVRKGPGRLTELRTKKDTFFDLAAIHVLAESTLDHLHALAPHSVFDVRRYRPNIVVGDADGGFVENGWMQHKLHAGGVELQPVVLTMRCIMTTLPQGDLPRDNGTLKAVAAHNRVEIPGAGTWSCVGLYAEVARPGHVQVGDGFAAE